MTNTYPIHPDDNEMLLDIRRYLIGCRVTSGWTQEELSLKINGTKGCVYGLEKGPDFQWRLSRLQQWPQPFGLRLSAQLVFDWGPDRQEDVDKLMSFIQRDRFVRVFSEMSEQTPEWQRSYLVAALRAARQCRGWDQAELGRRLGVSAGAVSRWEIVGDQVMLPKLLAHARALEGRLHLEVVR